MSVVLGILSEVQAKANEKISELFDRLVERIINPTVGMLTNKCIKHYNLKIDTKALGILYSRYKRQYRDGSITEEQLHYMVSRYKEARRAFKNTKCTCPEETNKLQYAIDFPISFDVGGGC